MKRLFAALGFLTICPVPASCCGEDELARSVPFFPVVGLLIGGIAAACAFGVGHVLPPMPAGVIVAIVLAAASGALHLDGLSDTADGFLSSRPRERILEIMKDSRVGPMGALVLVFVLSLKIAALASLDREWLWRAALLAPVAGRCALVMSLRILPYARATGLGSIFYQHRSALHSIWAVAVLGGTGWLAAREAGLAAAGFAVLLILLFAAHTYRKIGGSTGDTLGASCELSEVAAVVALAGWQHVAGGAA